ncbi:hypothetical protein [uncultured Streptococcus sp.]|uniref:hypothetical protein n=1 Tax=uncultured Streptococcus sp. TaxID=83427 RepID=UPI002604270E|nr:hypothetical protein [uncultured Streptococcus sp.]
MLKNLRSFLVFKHQDFFEKKKLFFLNAKQTESGAVKVILLILEDKTDYQNSNTNIGEQIIVTVANKSIADFEKFESLRTECKIVNVVKATIFGEYQNQLSIHADVTSTNAEGDKK